MRRLTLPLGPVILDPSGPELTDADRERLRHPAVGGVILFARHYRGIEQVEALCAEIAKLREPELLISVDHEGGRVQRFRTGFTPIPTMRSLGRAWDRSRDAGRAAAHAAGYVIAAELGAVGVDFSYTPVLDIDYGASEVIGDRAFHFDAIAVGALGAELVIGLAAGGMSAVAKHFPGHGFAAADSHVAVPSDERAVAAILRKDAAPYRAAIAAGLAGVMPAHVIYPAADAVPAGYSRFWLQQTLRESLGFEGLIFSDDLSMAGAGTAGNVRARADAALQAGCDMVLICNDASAQDELLEGLGNTAMSHPERAERMRRRGGRDLRRSVAYREALAALAKLEDSSGG